MAEDGAGHAGSDKGSNRQHEIALREREWCQQAISHRENVCLAHQRWVLAFITALVLALVSETIAINGRAATVAVLALALLGYLNEVVQRTPHDAVIERAEAIDCQLQRNGPYDGPRMGAMMSNSLTRERFCKILRRPRIFLPYLIFGGAGVTIAIVYLCSP